MTPLDEILGPLGHVVAQVVEAEFVVRAVGDIHRILPAALSGGLTGQDAARGQPQEAVNASHEIGLVLGEIIVDGHDVHALVRQRPQVGGHGGHQRLALAGLHLGDIAQMEGGAAHDLDVEGTHAQHPVGGLAHGGEGLGQEVIETLPVGVALLELDGDLLELGVSEVRVRVGERLDPGGDGIEPLEGAPLTDAKDPVNDRHAGFSLVGGGERGPRPCSPHSHRPVPPGADVPIVVDASRGAIVLPHDLAHCEHRARAGMRTGPVPRPAPGRLWTTGPSAGPS